MLRSAHNIALILLLTCIATAATSQGTTDEQLAAYYYNQGDFEKAALYYEKLYEERNSNEHYNYFLTSLLATENFKDAIRLAERHAKDHPNKVSYKIDIGQVHARAGDDAKADKQYDKVIKSLNKASVNQILDAGKAFAAINENDRALEVYYNARKQMGNAYPFHFQIAQILGQKGDVEGMVNEYLDVLDVSPGYLQSVQNTLNRVVGFDEENKYSEVLQSALLERIQKRPSDQIYAEMLIWIYAKQRRFGAALLQVKAIDKRLKEDGERVMDLSDAALNNYQYDVAIDGYQYVKDKGPAGYYYFESVGGLLRAMNAKLTAGLADQPAVERLDAEYESVLSELGLRANTAPIALDYAHFLAFYASKFDTSAVSRSTALLQQALLIPRLSDQDAARLKTELADIYVLQNRIWDASLLYGQVEKAFKHDEIGHTAKLKNALVFYYSGDFGWSQAQLNALKGSTSKLISNDAIELSAFITENIGLDSNLSALQAYARIDLMIAQHKYDSALSALDTLAEAYPSHELSDNIIFRKAEIMASLGKFEDAVALFLKIPEHFPFGILTDNALMQAALINEDKLKQTDQAMQLYEQIITEHTSSLFVVEARKRYRNLRGDQIQ